MSKQADLPERLRTTGATSLESRLLEAASREQPSRELSERMAQAIGISLIAPDTIAGGGKTDVATSAATKASGSLVPWLSGALVAACVAAGAYVAMRAPPRIAPNASSVAVAPAPSALSEPSAPTSSEPTTTAETAAGEALPRTSDDSPTKTTVPQRGRRSNAAGELADQIALVDAARSALAAGSAQRALSIAREYQSEYPKGTFRPEVAAVKIEALVKLGRTGEARTLAERFVVAYGAGPLAERVAHLAHLAEP